MELAIAIAANVVLGPRVTWEERLSYLFGPPGWRHGGLGHTTAARGAADSAWRERQAMMGASTAA